VLVLVLHCLSFLSNDITIVCVSVSASASVCVSVLYYLVLDRVIETPTPVNVSAIRGKWLREHINDKAGCCGAAELIKLYAYRMVEFDWVIHLDADVLIFQVTLYMSLLHAIVSPYRVHL
jgi:hypothetical protein